MDRQIQINSQKIGPGHSVYIIAEMSANHNQNYDQAVKIIEAAKEAGADAVKLQTYKPDTITIDCDKNNFRIKNTIWQGKTLYDLYDEAYTPWEWQPRLKKVADDLGITFFSSPFDLSAVDFLEEFNVQAYKIASFELVDLPLLKKIAETGKLVIMSTGMAKLSEIEEALQTLQDSGAEMVALLKCTSSYPASPEEMNLRTIPHMMETFNVPVGLSDHTMGYSIAVSAVTLGACIIEKHFTLSRKYVGPDSSFSMEPQEFREMVKSIRAVEKAVGKVWYQPTKGEIANRALRRSLFVVKDMIAGEKFSEENVRSIRPGYGLHTRYLTWILGKRAGSDISRGTPLIWEMIK
jgi:pseudaminic acid synthase